MQKYQHRLWLRGSGGETEDEVDDLDDVRMIGPTLVCRRSAAPDLLTRTNLFACLWLCGCR